MILFEENMPTRIQQPIIFPIRQIYAVNSKSCLILGTFLNLILIWLVLKKTPKEMKVYSKIVLQTCFCDLALLITSDLVQPILVVNKRIAMVLENGLTTSMPAPWNIIIYNCWFYNSYFVSVGIVVQFIYRYLTLCRNVKIKMCHYFGMLALAAAIEGILLGFFFWIGLPPKEARIDDEQLLRILGVPFDQQQIPWEMRPALHGDRNDLRWIIWICCFVVFSTLCYTIIWFCATRMLQFVRKNLKMDGTSMRVVEVNRQMMRNMIIQASIPLFHIFIFMMAAYASVAESKPDWFVCFCMLLGPLVNWIPVLNPLVTIFTVTPYRKTLIRVGPSLPSGSTRVNIPQSKVFRRVSNISSDLQRRQQEEARQKYEDQISRNIHY